MLRVIFKLSLWLLSLAALAAIGLIAAVILRPSLAAPHLADLAGITGAELEIASLKLEPWPPALQATGLKVEVPGAYSIAADGLSLAFNHQAAWRDIPWFRAIEADGLQVLIHPQPPSDEPIRPDLGFLSLLLISETMRLDSAAFRFPAAMGTMAITGLDASIRGQGGQRTFSLDAAVLLLGEDGQVLSNGLIHGQGDVQPGNTLKAGLEYYDAAIKLPRLSGKLEGKASFVLGEGQARLEGLEIIMPNPVYTWPGMPEFSPGEALVSLSGKAELDGTKPELRLKSLYLGEIVKLEGALSGQGFGNLSGSLQGEVDNLKEARPLIRPFLPDEMADALISGGASLKLSLAPDDTWQLEVKPRGLKAAWPSRGLKLALEGDALISPEKLSGGVQLSGAYHSKEIALKSFRLSGDLAGDLHAPGMHDLRLSIPKGALTTGPKAKGLPAIQVRGRASWSEGVARLDSLKLTTRGVDLSGAIEAKAGVISWDLGGKLQAADIPTIAAPLLSIEPTGWTGSGSLGAKSKGSFSQGVIKADSVLTLQEVDLASPDSWLLAEKLTGKLKLQLEHGATTRARLKGGIDSGGLVAGVLYLEYGTTPFSLDADLSRKGNAINIHSLQAGLGGVGRGSVKGSLQLSPSGLPGYDLKLEARDIDLSRAFNLFVKEPFSLDYPFLDETDLKGRASLDLALDGVGYKADITGRLKIHGAEFISGELTMAGLELDLPLEYRLGADPPAPARPEPGSKYWGKLVIGSFSLPGMVLEDLDNRIALKPNRLWLEQPLELELYGSSLSFSHLMVDQPLSGDFELSCRGRLAPLDLASLSGPDIVMQGSLGGDLGLILLNRKYMSVPGVLKGDFFGGELQVTGLDIDRPLSDDREISTDISFDNVDLGSFTEALGMGLITGRLRGEVKDLSIAFGQPVGFSMDLRSVKTPGVKQEVSLRAVNAISVVGTGNSLGGAGIQLFSAIVQSFPYEEIGIRCLLNNDVFKVRGLIKDGDLEYLVKRPTIMGINVINRSPDNEISFSDMLERVKRVLGQD